MKKTPKDKGIEGPVEEFLTTPFKESVAA